MVKDIIVIDRKNETILIFNSFRILKINTQLTPSLTLHVSISWPTFCKN